MSFIQANFCFSLDKFDLYVDLSIDSKGVTALFGPSGCGKTTLLRSIAGLNKCKGGKLIVDGKVWQDEKTFLPPHKRPIGYVFQEASLFDHLSVKDNLLFGHKRSTNQLSINEVVALMGLTDLLQRSTHKLSGGERQRVAIARALLSGPEILLMDEPLAALDKFSKEEILPYLERLHREFSIPIIYISHDLSEIERLADHMIFLEQGKITAQGPVANLISDPNLPFAKLPDAATLFEGCVKSFDETYGLTTLSVKGADIIVGTQIREIGSNHRFKITASDVSICRTRATEGSSILNGPAARISSIENAGPFKSNIFLNLGEDGCGAPLLARITKKSCDALNLKQGDLVHALIKGVALNGQNNFGIL
jgi:molybdate transport system ATP-binding protein